jgi:probable rRNA maturation factor
VTVSIELENRSSVAVDEARLRRVLAAALAAEGVDDGDVGVAVVGEPEMAELNAAHRGKAEPTDVLSFPLDGRDPLPADVPRQLGDLVICPARAEADGTALDVLMVHGALHLLGWDHETDAGEMLVRQAAVLEEVGARAAEPA